MGLIANILGLLSTLFVVAIGLIVVFLMVVFVCDVIQTKDAIRRNFPVIGHLRNLFTELGKFFRQYFFAMDGEELPFNRELRNWVYRAAAGDDNTVMFESQTPPLTR